MSPRPCRVQASTTPQSRKAGKVQRIENLEGKSTASGEKFVNNRDTSKVSKSSKGEVRKRLFSSDCYPFELPKSLTIIAGILEWLVCYSQRLILVIFLKDTSPTELLLYPFLTDGEIVGLIVVKALQKDLKAPVDEEIFLPARNQET